MQKIIVFLAAVILFTASNLTTAAAQDIPDDIYQWVQASPRISYYFNKQEMKYAVGSDGLADTNVLEVPVLQQYDPIEKQDIIDKRRWNDGDVSGFGNLWGYAGIVHIDIKARTVTYIQDEYLDNWWAPILNFNSDRVDSIDKMSVKNLDRNFYEAIITYAADHKQEMIDKQKEKIKPENVKASGTDDKYKHSGKAKKAKQQ